MSYPFGLAVDVAGNLYIADTSNFRIRKVSPSGVITTVAGNGTLGFSGDGGPATGASLGGPLGNFLSVAVHAAVNLYIADWGNQRIRKVSPTGVITTVAGNGIRGFSDDGGPATRASLKNPRGVAVDGAGNLYIADSFNDRIRKVLATPPSYSVAPSSLTFSARAGAPVVAPQLVAVTGAVPGLGWSASASASWVTVSPSSGAIPD